MSDSPVREESFHPEETRLTLSAETIALRSQQGRRDPMRKSPRKIVLKLQELKLIPLKWKRKKRTSIEPRMKTQDQVIFDTETRMFKINKNVQILQRS